MLGSARGLVFDLGGTLVDTLDDLWLALNSALREHGHRPVERAVVLASVHAGLNGTARAALRDQVGTEHGLAALQSSYLQHYRRREHAASRPYAGVREYLDDCRQRCIPMVICTNKSSEEGRDLLLTLGLAGHFVGVIGLDTCGTAKPDPAPLRRALALLGVTAEHAAFVGDSEFDSLCASRGGVRFVLHEHGYGRDAALRHPCAGRFRRYADLMPAACPPEVSSPHRPPDGATQA
ncbi:HAD family hydrolase [Piscinibacter sp.]|uniref:HAD family hydrolase n=1 Tax=Piscinibacter sp. TaxID=1903157 RepID=UPI002CF54728|nr:HAD-IA family hydrolase [Albitalea sp.]HUG25666.1 HAD-IA family hydrolase [Albitalea sp.]